MGRNEKIVKISLVIGVIFTISLLHYLTQRQARYYHLFYRELYFLPVVLGGIWFGLRGAAPHFVGHNYPISPGSNHMNGMGFR